MPTAIVRLLALGCAVAGGCAVDTEPLGAKGSCATGFVVGIQGDGTLLCSDAVDRLATRGVQGDLEVSGKVGVGTAADDGVAAVNVAGAVAVGRGAGGVAGGSPSSVLVHGRSDTAATASAVQLGDNASGTSRQFAIVNGRSDSGQVPGSLFVMASDGVSADPLSAGHGVPVMSMTWTGHVGIGTRTPAADLDVRGQTRLGPDLLLANDAAPANQRVWRQYVDSGSWYLATMPDSLATEDEAIRVSRTGASVTSIYLTASRVGINNSAPQSALHVKGYVQLDVTGDGPPAADCVAEGDWGRMKVEADAGRLWVCVAAGWKSTVLGP